VSGAPLPDDQYRAGEAATLIGGRAVLGGGPDRRHPARTALPKQPPHHTAVDVGCMEHDGELFWVIEGAGKDRGVIATW
jgi:hypothetical protein